MILFTTDLVMSWHPCWDYPRERVSQICGDHGITARDLAIQIHLPILDRIWALTHGLPDQERRLFGIDCVERVVEYLDDQIPTAISVVRQYVFGLINEDVMTEISDSVWKACSSLKGIEREAAVAVAWITLPSYEPKTEWKAVWKVTKCFLIYPLLYSLDQDCSWMEKVDVEQVWQLDRLLEWYEHGDVLKESHLELLNYE